MIKIYFVRPFLWSNKIIIFSPGLIRLSFYNTLYAVPPSKTQQNLSAHLDRYLT